MARQAQVSKSTVSRVLNNLPVVNAETRRRVLEAMKELSYTPNAMARGLSIKRSRTIGLVLSDITNPFLTEVARGVEDIMNGYSYNVILCNTDGRVEKEAAYTRLLLEKRVDGIIYTSVKIEATDLSELRRYGIPFVLAGRALPNFDSDLVIVDDELGGFQATQHLLELGHRRIGYIRGTPGASATEDRQKGYERALTQAEVEVDPDLIVEGDFKQEGGYKAAKTLLSLPERPTAIFAANDFMAIGALEALYEANLRVPEDIALVGFDDISFARLHTIQLTTVAQPKYELGAIAARLLLGRIEGDIETNPAQDDAMHDKPYQQPYQHIILPPRLQIRKTCGALRKV